MAKAMPKGTPVPVFDVEGDGGGRREALLLPLALVTVLALVASPLLIAPCLDEDSVATGAAAGPAPTLVGVPTAGVVGAAAAKNGLGVALVLLLLLLLLLESLPAVVALETSLAATNGFWAPAEGAAAVGAAAAAKGLLTDPAVVAKKGFTAATPPAAAVGASDSLALEELTTCTIESAVGAAFAAVAALADGTVTSKPGVVAVPPPSSACSAAAGENGLVDEGLVPAVAVTAGAKPAAEEPIIADALLLKLLPSPLGPAVLED